MHPPLLFDIAANGFWGGLSVTNWFDVYITIKLSFSKFNWSGISLLTMRKDTCHSVRLHEHGSYNFDSYTGFLLHV